MVLSGFSFVFWDCLCFSWLPNSSLSTGVFFTKLQFALSPDKALLLQAPWISGKTNWLSSGHLPLLSNHCGQGWARGIRGGKMSHPDPYNVSPREQRGSFTQKGLGVRADKTANVCFLFWVFVFFFFFLSFCFLPHHAACVTLQFLTRNCTWGLDRAQSPNQWTTRGFPVSHFNQCICVIEGRKCCNYNLGLVFSIPQWFFDLLHNLIFFFLKPFNLHCFLPY